MNLAFSISNFICLYVYHFYSAYVLSVCNRHFGDDDHQEINFQTFKQLTVDTNFHIVKVGKQWQRQMPGGPLIHKESLKHHNYTHKHKSGSALLT